MGAGDLMTVTPTERRAAVTICVNRAIASNQPVTIVASHRARIERVLARTFPSDEEQAHRADVADAALAALTSQ